MMRLSKLVELLEREMPGIADAPSTRTNLATLYAEGGCDDDALRALVSAATSPKATRPKRAHPRRTRP